MMARDGCTKMMTGVKVRRKLREPAMWVCAGRAFLVEGGSSKALRCGVMCDVFEEQRGRP